MASARQPDARAPGSSSLVELAPEHPDLIAFEAQIGEKLGAGIGRRDRRASWSPIAETGRAALPQPRSTRPRRSARRSEPSPSRRGRHAPAPRPRRAPSRRCAARRSRPRRRARRAAGEARGRTSTSCSPRPEKQEQAKRYNEYVKTLVELAEAVDDPAEKIELLPEGRRSLHDQVLERGRGREVLRGDPRRSTASTRRRDRLPPPELREAARLGEAHRPR